MSSSVEKLGGKPQALLELCEISKLFPGTLANDAIDLRVMPGEIHGLVGENGAGKTTLVKIIYGLLRPDQGRVYWEGNAIIISGPSQARSLGIGMVFQHFSLFEALTVLENIALAIDEKWKMQELRSRIDEVSENYGLSIDPDRYVHSLSVGERQRVEIVRCLLQSPKLLILDEPTSVLTPQEAQSLFETLDLLSNRGCSILYISHKLHEIKKICTVATILREGKVVASCDASKEPIKNMAELLVGSRLPVIKREHSGSPGVERICVDNLYHTSKDPFSVKLKDISFTVCSGEILGIAGVAGNGQTELMSVLSGENTDVSQSSIIRFNNQTVTSKGPGERRLVGAGFVPEQRQGHAAVTEMSLLDNVFLTALKTGYMENKGFIDRSKARTFAESVISKFDVRTTGVQAETGSLSGGNLQKFIVGRELLQQPSILIIEQPTWGVDVGAAIILRRALLDLAKSGAAVIIISQDLDEIFEICDRIAVIADGNLSTLGDIASVSMEEIGVFMSGQKL